MDQVSLGLITGALLGYSVLITRRQRALVQFQIDPGWLTLFTSLGEIAFTSTPGAETVLTCSLDCRGFTRLHMLAASLSFFPSLALAYWVFNGHLIAALVSALAIAVLVYVVFQRILKERLQRQIRAYLSNSSYLKID